MSSSGRQALDPSGVALRVERIRRTSLKAAGVDGCGVALVGAQGHRAMVCANDDAAAAECCDIAGGQRDAGGDERDNAADTRDEDNDVRDQDAGRRDRTAVGRAVRARRCDQATEGRDAQSLHRESAGRQRERAEAAAARWSAAGDRGEAAGDDEIYTLLRRAEAVLSRQR
jgi:hypothetical protein